MKHSSLLVVIILSIFIVSGCVGGDQQPDDPVTGDPAVQQTEQTLEEKIANLEKCGSLYREYDTGPLCPTLESLIQYVDINSSGAYVLRLPQQSINFDPFTFNGFGHEVECEKGEGENPDYYYCAIYGSTYQEGNGSYISTITATLTDSDGDIFLVENYAKLVFSIENGNYIYRGTKCRKNSGGTCPWYDI